MSDGRSVDHELLSVLPSADRVAVLAIAERHRFDAGEILWLEGDRADALHLLLDGWVAVRVSTPSGDVVTLTVLGAGDCFGEVALMGGYHRRTASIVAIQAVETLAIRRADFDVLRVRQPAVERFLVEVLARAVRRLTAQVTEALYVPAEARVLHRLADLAGQYAATEVGGVDGEVVVPLTQTDLASMAGTTRQTCNRVLQRLAGAGCVRLERGRIVVIDRRALIS
jgi:CRP-like cAMP-binding protein